MTVPASIRTNNPGAMWPGPVATRLGSTQYETLADGNKIAIFDDPVAGAAAQIALLSDKYAGMPLDQAIAKWSGGNSSAQYVDNITKQTGLAPNTVLTPELLSDPATAIPLAKAMAQHEAGTSYPLSDDQWAKAIELSHSQVADTSQPSPTIDSGAASPPPVQSSGPDAGTVPATPQTQNVGLLADTVSQNGADQATTQDPGLLGGIFGNLDQSKLASALTTAGKDLSQPGNGTAAPPAALLPTGAPQLRRPVDMAQLAALVSSRGRLGI